MKRATEFFQALWAGFVALVGLVGLFMWYQWKGRNERLDREAKRREEIEARRAEGQKRADQRVAADAVNDEAHRAEIRRIDNGIELSRGEMDAAGSRANSVLVDAGLQPIDFDAGRGSQDPLPLRPSGGYRGPALEPGKPVDQGEE